MSIKNTAFWKYLLLTLFAVVCAASLWVTSYSSEADMLIRLKLYGLPDTLAIVDWPSKTFEVRVRGPKSMIEKLEKKEPEYPVNLADAREGVQPIDIKAERLPLPDSITVISVSTGDTTIRIEKTIRKTLPVNLQTKGNPAFGYTVADKRPSPRSVKVKGPKSKLVDLDYAPTHPIDVSGTSGTFKKNFALNLPEGIYAIQKEQPFSATIVVEEERTNRNLENIVVKGRNTHYEFIIQPETIRLMVSATVRTFSAPLSDEGISVYLDLEGLAPGIYVKPAIIHLPENIKLIKAAPQVFTVQILQPQEKGAGE